MKFPFRYALGAALGMGVAVGAQAVTCRPGVQPAKPDSIYTAHGNGTVTDTETGLMWKACLQGQDTLNACAGNAADMTWDEAQAAAASENLAGHSDWRVPTVDELFSLVEPCSAAFEPFINDAVFTNLPLGGGVSWSASLADASLVWGVPFHLGRVSLYGHTGNSFNVRLVRGTSSATWPVLASAGLMFGTLTDAGATMGGSSTRDGTGYWLVVPQGSAEPTPAQVKAQADYGSVTVSARGSKTVQANVYQADLAVVAGLSPATGYDFYFVVDAAGSLSSTSLGKETFTTTATVAGACGSAHNPAAAPLLAEAPSANLCSAGTPSGVSWAGPSGTTWGWTCMGTTAATCQAPRGYAVTPVAGAGGSMAPGAVQTVAPGSTPSFTVTPAANHGLVSVSGCGGSLSGSTFTTGPVLASCQVQAVFAELVPSPDLTLPQGVAQAGQALGLALLKVNGWQITQAGAQAVASLANAPALPPGVTLPYGLVSLNLASGSPGSEATVVLTYPQPLPPGARYYKYGKTRDDGSAHWYPFSGAVIAGNTVTLTLKDGWAGDDDLQEDGVIRDPGGVAVLAPTPAPAGATAIPTLGEWALVLLAGLLGLFSLGALRRRG